MMEELAAQVAASLALSALSFAAKEVNDIFNKEKYESEKREIADEINKNNEDIRKEFQDAKAESDSFKAKFKNRKNAFEEGIGREREKKDSANYEYEIFKELLTNIFKSFYANDDSNGFQEYLHSLRDDHIQFMLHRMDKFLLVAKAANKAGVFLLSMDEEISSHRKSLALLWQATQLKYPEIAIFLAMYRQQEQESREAPSPHRLG